MSLPGGIEVNGGMNPSFIGAQNRVCGAAVNQYAAVKIDSTGRRVMLAAGDSGALMVGIAMSRTTAAGQMLMVLELYGIEGYMISDGTTAITAGELVSPSATVPGAVFEDAGDPVGTALQDVAATPGLLVLVI